MQSIGQDPHPPGAGGRPPFGRTARAQDVIWPARSGPAVAMRLADRPIEPGVTLADRFPAESVLRDLAPDGGADDALAIVARFAALRVVLLATDRSLDGPALSAERDAALAYAAGVPAGAEARVLGQIARLAGPGPDGSTRDLPRLLVAAASAAERRGHVHGAFGLLHTAWTLGRATGNWREAAGAARAIGELSERSGARRAARLWSRRARSSERRAAATVEHRPAT